MKESTNKSSISKVSSKKKLRELIQKFFGHLTRMSAHTKNVKWTKIDNANEMKIYFFH